MREKTICRALVDRGPLGDLLQLQSRRIALKRFKNLQNLHDDPNWGRFRSTCSEHVSPRKYPCGSIFYYMKLIFFLLSPSPAVPLPANEHPGPARRKVLDRRAAG